jgi:tripartite-type tricarboxylate transporter receptor subunit TctC
MVAGLIGKANMRNARSAAISCIAIAVALVAAPAKLPEDIAQKISASLDRALNDDAFRASLEKIGFPVFRPRSAAAIAEFIDADRAQWSKVIQTQNISLD